ncbi:MAG TPA: hypothetical protein VG873_04655 [Burkholderiales bacterium]|nr:hypothetical protein [Burkholderiales bacterium]
MLRFVFAALCAAAMPAFACSLAADAPPAQYAGDCLNGLAHGRGVARSAAYTYEGEFSEGRRHGRGALSISDGTRYVGEFRYGKRHGQGSTTNPDGLRHEGAWVEGEIHGYGRSHHPNGDVYEGEFRNFQRSGRGVLVTADGRRFEGEWQAGRFTGPAAPSARELAQACHQRADSCETACAVGALGGVLLSRGKADGNKANAECAASCEATKQSCLGTATAKPAGPAAAPAPSAAYIGPDMTKCFATRAHPSGNSVEIVDQCEGRNRSLDDNVAYCLSGPTHPKVRHKACGGPEFAKWMNWANSGEAYQLGIVTFTSASSYLLSNYGARVELFGCRRPYWVTDIRWDGRRLTGTCAKCGRFSIDGKATCLRYED